MARECSTVSTTEESYEVLRKKTANFARATKHYPPDSKLYGKAVSGT
jgi:hypothetical protein